MKIHEVHKAKDFLYNFANALIECTSKHSTCVDLHSAEDRFRIHMLSELWEDFHTVCKGVEALCELEKDDKEESDEDLGLHRR